MGFWRLFGPFSRLFPDFWVPGPGDFFETFLRLFGFWPRDSFSQVHGTSSLQQIDLDELGVGLGRGGRVRIRRFSEVVCCGYETW